MVIDYNDGDAQYGQLKIYYDGNIVISLNDLSYTGCDGEVMVIKNQGSTTAFTCPHCFRNIGCGLMGKYTRGGKSVSGDKYITNFCIGCSLLVTRFAILTIFCLLSFSLQIVRDGM